MKSLEEIKKILNEYRPILKERFKINSIGIFGSYVRRKQQQKSDIDILVEFREIVDLFAFVQLEDFLNPALGLRWIWL